MQRRDLKLIIVIPTKMDKYFRYNFVPRTKSIDRSVVQKVIRIRSNNLLYHSSDDRVSWHKSNQLVESHVAVTHAEKFGRKRMTQVDRITPLLAHLKIYLSCFRGCWPWLSTGSGQI